MTPEQAAQPRIGNWGATRCYVEKQVGSEFYRLNADGTWHQVMESDGIKGATLFENRNEAEAAIARLTDPTRCQYHGCNKPAKVSGKIRRDSGRGLLRPRDAPGFRAGCS